MQNLCATPLRHFPDRLEAYPDLLRLLSYCDSLAEKGALPHRAAFRPSQARGLFGHIYLLDVLDGGRDYYYRLWGQFWETVFGLDLYGMKLSEIEGAGLDKGMRPKYDALVADARPHFSLQRVIWPDGATIEYARLAIPFAGDDGKTAMLLVAAVSDKSLEDLIFFRGHGEARFAAEPHGDIPITTR